jgi:hypothetical protein
MTRSTTPIVQTHSDFAPEPDSALSKDHFWAEYWPALIATLQPIHDDLKLIGQMLEGISTQLETQNKQNQAASEINQMNLTAIRAQLQGGIMQATIIPSTVGRQRQQK